MKKEKWMSVIGVPNKTLFLDDQHVVNYRATMKDTPVKKISFIGVQHVLIL